MSQNIIRMPQVLARTGLGKTTTYEKISKGEFPSPIHLSARSVGWLESEIDAWIEARVKASRGDASNVEANNA